MTALAPSTVKGFAAVYALLALLTVGSLAGGYAAYQSHGTAAKVQHVQAELVRTVVKGDVAVVTCRVVVTDGLSEQSLLLAVTVNRGIWQPVGIAAA